MNKLLSRSLATIAITAAFFASCKKSEVIISTGDGGAIRLQVVSPEIIRVTQSPDGKFNDRKSLAVLPQKLCKDYEVSDAMGKVHLTTKALAVDVYKADGSIHFYDGEGNLLSGDGRAEFKPITVEGKDAWSTCVSFDSPEDEAFYGLGQQQAGEFDHTYICRKSGLCAILCHA